MTLVDVIARERSGILAEIALLSGVLPLVAVKDIYTLEFVPSPVRCKHPAEVCPLGATAADGWVLSCPPLKYKSYWAHMDDDDYRSNCVRFLREHVGLQITSIPPEYDVDHLYNRERARQYGLTFIRMFLVPRSPNRSHGAGYEKAKGASERSRQVSDMRTMDEIGFMKFMGLPSPRVGQPLSPQHLTHLRWVAATTGLDMNELRRTVENLMDIAYSDWAP